MRRDVVVAGVVLSLAILWALRAVIPLLALSAVYAVVTWPLVKHASRWMPRGLAAAAVHASLFLGLLAALIFLGPIAYAQWQNFVPDLPKAVWSVFSALPSSFQSYLAGELANANVTFSGWAREAFQTGTAVVRSTSGILGALIIVPVLAGYLQLDAPRYMDALNARLPEDQKETADRARAAVAIAIGGFFRGQIIVSAIVGIMVFIVLEIMQIPHAATIAAFTAIFDLVPYLGGLAAFVPSLLLALVSGGIVKTLTVAALLVVAFEIEAQVLSPLIIGPQTRLPASAIIVSLLCGSALFGIVGLYLAVPIVAAAVAGARVFLAHQRRIGPG